MIVCLESLAKRQLSGADANRRTILEDEGAGTWTTVACTGNDESNIMAVEARELGAVSNMCVVGRPDYANVVGKLGIDCSEEGCDSTPNSGLPK